MWCCIVGNHVLLTDILWYVMDIGSRIDSTYVAKLHVWNSVLHSLISRVNFKYEKAVNVDEMFLLHESL